MSEQNQIIFHGGCHGCTQQEKQPEGTDFCFGCCYFAAEWDKPNLSNRPPSESELERQMVLARRAARGEEI